MQNIQSECAWLLVGNDKPNTPVDQCPITNNYESTGCGRCELHERPLSAECYTSDDCVSCRDSVVSHQWSPAGDDIDVLPCRGPWCRTSRSADPATSSLEHGTSHRSLHGQGLCCNSTTVCFCLTGLSFERPLHVRLGHRRICGDCWCKIFYGPNALPSNQHCQNALGLTLFLHFKGHFPGEPALAGTRMSPFWILRVMEVVVTTGPIRHFGALWLFAVLHLRNTLTYLLTYLLTCKAPVKSSPTTNQQPVFWQAGCSSCRPTNSVRALRSWRCNHNNSINSNDKICHVIVLSLFATERSTEGINFLWCSPSVCHPTLREFDCTFISAMQCITSSGVLASEEEDEDTGIRGLIRGMVNLPQGNQELLVVEDKVGRPQGEFGVSKSMGSWMDIFPLSALILLIGWQEGHLACKKAGCWFVGGAD